MALVAYPAYLYSLRGEAVAVLEMPAAAAGGRSAVWLLLLLAPSGHAECVKKEEGKTVVGLCRRFYRISLSSSPPQRRAEQFGGGRGGSVADGRKLRSAISIAT